MDTIGTIVARLRSALKETTSDSMYSNRGLWNEFVSEAKVFIKRDADNERKIYKTTEAWQKVCLKMEKSSPLLCNLSIPLTYSIYKSLFKIPDLFETSTGPLVQFISTPDNSVNITLVTPLEFQIKTNLRYSKGRFAFIYDGYLWTNLSYSNLVLSGVFFETKVDCECNPIIKPCSSMLDKPCGVPSYLVAPAVTSTLQKLLPTLNRPTDNVVNMSESQRENSI
jgi:hypothetical protein